MHQTEIIVLLFAAVAVVPGRRADRARHERTCIELRSAPAGNETQSRDRFLFFLPPLQNRHRIFLLSAAYSGSERARMILSDRAIGQNCFASQGGIGLF